MVRFWWLVSVVGLGTLQPTTAWSYGDFSEAKGSAVDYTKPVADSARSCASMIATSDFRYTVTGARLIDTTATTPEHCRLAGLIPTEIRFEVNLPTRWNGRLYMFGNGGLAGTPAIDPGKQRTRDQALAAGFATAYTDTGHDRRIQAGGTFAHNNFHKLVDYGFRAVHLTIAAAKALASEHYDRPHDYAYWQGCSTGGRQAMISAQRFPEDFDGIIAGAPAADYSGLKFSQAWRVAAISKSGLSHAKVLNLAKHIYARCDALDGLEDGLLDDPTTCDFQLDQLPQCGKRARDDCFTKREIAALKKYYQPVILADREIYPAHPVGSEVLGVGYDGIARSGWIPWLINEPGVTTPVLLDQLGSDFFRYMVFTKDDPAFNWTDFDFKEAPDGLAEFRDIVDAIDPNLAPFHDAGGKLLSYFGWADPDINPLTLIDYHSQVRGTDPNVDDFFRVFMVPGMFHCRGGPGPDRFDAMTALVNWVERNVAPARLHATHVENGEAIYTRPLCHHPERAIYRGTGAVESADNFHCKAPNATTPNDLERSNP